MPAPAASGPLFSGYHRRVITTRADWAKLVTATAACFIGFHLLADALGSMRGEAGLAVGSAVVVVVLALDRLLFGRTWLTLAAMGVPALRGLVAVAVPALLLLAVFPLLAATAGADLSMYEGWARLLPGLFGQGGIAEELLFRGFLYAHIRRGRTFWRAAALATPPFVAAHLFLFLTMPWPIALASTALAAIISIPMARLFELGGNTIWAPAILHFVVQGAIKVILLDGPASQALPMVWMAASAALPFLVFAIRPRPEQPA
jgi:membrane protease YdiL (CAAX protease family)